MALHWIIKFPAPERTGGGYTGNPNVNTWGGTVGM